MLFPISFLFYLGFGFYKTENFEDVHSQQQRGDSRVGCVNAGVAEGDVTPVGLIKEWSGCC